MASGVVLDSSIAIEHLRGRLDIAQKVDPAEPLFLALVSLGELYKGVYRSGQPARNRTAVELFFRQAAVLYPDAGTADHYGRIAAELECKGSLIPQNDIWIAATAIECHLPLVTRDEHFRRVEGLVVLMW